MKALRADIVLEALTKLLHLSRVPNQKCRKTRCIDTNKMSS